MEIHFTLSEWYRLRGLFKSDEATREFVAGTTQAILDSGQSAEKALNAFQAQVIIANAMQRQMRRKTKRKGDD